MKIISGTLKGRTIKIPKLISKKIRPTKSQIREAIFNILSSGKDFYKSQYIFDDAVILDLCCGSGSLGLEALSRGAAFCYFIDKDLQVLSSLEQNVHDLNLQNNSSLIKMDIMHVLPAKQKVDIIFIDPPYAKFGIGKVLENLDKNHWINDHAIIVVEDCFQKDLAFNQDYFKLVTSRVYGRTKLTILEKNVAC